MLCLPTLLMLIGTFLPKDFLYQILMPRIYFLTIPPRPPQKKSNYSSEYFHGLIFVGHQIATGCLEFAIGIGMYAVVRLEKK